MSTDIALIVKKMLLELGEASLPSIGTLVLARQSANYAKDENRIYPPSFNLHFSENISNLDKTIAYASAYYKITEAQAKVALEQYSNELFSSLNATNSGEIIDVGTFSIENQRVKFTPNELLATWYTNGLTDITPKRVEKSFDPIVVGSSYSETPKDQTWRWLPLLLLLCGITIFYKYFLNNSSESKLKPQTEVAVNDSVNNQTNNSQEVSADEEEIASSSIDTCIIITGNFSTAKYVLKMSDKIERLGYTVYLEDNAMGTRVGLIIDCTNMDLQKTIYEIRDSIAKDAWYLKPSITIE